MLAVRDLLLAHDTHGIKTSWLSTSLYQPTDTAHAQLEETAWFRNDTERKESVEFSRNEEFPAKRESSSQTPGR